MEESNPNIFNLILMVNIFYTNDFERAAKKLLKKYPSLKLEFQKLATDLLDNPKIGTPIYDKTREVRKIKLSIDSKGKGKRGGARVITLLLNTENNDQNVWLLFVYDKKEYGDVNEDYILGIVEEIEQNNTTKDAL